MKAVICTKYGPPEVLQIQDVPKPTPKNNEILVRIIASAVNSGDVRVRGLAVQGFLKVIMRLVLGFTKPRKPILGVVFSGVVEIVGVNTSRFNVGDKVFGMTGFKFGTHAEYIAINQYSNVLVMPENATYEEAAVIVFGGHTAIYFFNKMKIAEKRNTTILIIGATGAVGSSAIQIAKYFGANITAVCSSSGKDFVESLGVEDIILYDREDFLKQPNQYDFVFDAVGKTTKKQCRKLLRDGGVYKTVGGLETASESKEQLELLKLLFEEGLLKAVIDKTYTLEGIVEAHRYVDSGRKKGNLVLKITD